ncbi:MAG: hypothetical protein ABI947_03460 [Chloroflexota bacterium]
MIEEFHVFLPKFRYIADRVLRIEAETWLREGKLLRFDRLTMSLNTLTYGRTTVEAKDVVAVNPDWVGQRLDIYVRRRGSSVLFATIQTHRYPNGHILYPILKEWVEINRRNGL